MANCFIILPNQLFNKKYIKKFTDYNFYIIEDTLFFKDTDRISNFNKLKLVLHRASMKYYFDYMIDNKFNVTYIDFINSDYNFLKKYKNISMFEPDDHLFKKRILTFIKKNNITINFIDSPLFMLTHDDIYEYKSTIKNNKNKNITFYHKHFYDWQIKKLNIPYIDRSYDSMNRESVPKNIDIPNNIIKKNDNTTEYVIEAKKYVNNNFKTNYGDVENFFYPITHKTSKKWLNSFIKERLHSFGTYQDAIMKDESFLFHSLLSAVINIGLLTPNEVVDTVIKYYEKNKKTIKINNFEGFIRQVIGWREYMRMLYVLYYDELVSSNYFNNKKKLNEKWYTGSLGIEPVDNSIIRGFKYGYLHHIERLMVMLNFMGLARIHPNEIYKWFMEFAIDSYDWVMIGNVYGMGYHNTNIMRKPYLSTSNYIIKMSNYKPDDKWDKIWDAMFYKFLTDNKSKLKGGAAVYLRNLVYFEKKTKKEQTDIFNIINI